MLLEGRMESIRSTSVDKSGTGLRMERKPFEIDHTSLLQGRSTSSRLSTRSPYPEPERTKSSITSSSPDWTYKGLANTAWDRVGFLRGALGDRNSLNSQNGLGAEGLNPMDRGLKIDRTQSLMTATGYSSAAGPTYKPIHRDPMLDRTKSLNPDLTVSSSSYSSSVTDNSAPKLGQRAGFTPTPLTRSGIFEQPSDESSPPRSFKGSHSSLSRTRSATPTEALRSKTPDEKATKEKIENKEEDGKKKGKPKLRKQSTTSSSSSEDEEQEENSTQKREFTLPYSPSDRSRSVTPQSTNSRTPTTTTSPVPRSVLDSQSPTNRNYYTPVRTEAIQKDSDKSSAITGLKTALELAQRKSIEDKKIIEDLKNQLISCKEEKAKEDPKLKAALEDALREIRENKETIAMLHKQLNDRKRKHDVLQLEVSALEGKLQQKDSYLSQDVTSYKSRVTSLEDDNVNLKREKDELSERMAVLSGQLDALEKERTKEKQEMEHNLREMQEKVVLSSRDKLYAAIKTEDIDAIENLLQTPMDLDAVITPDNSGRRAIHLAAENVKMASVINTLIEAKVDINALDNDGETALHIASRSGRGRIVKALLDAKADWSVVNVEGWTAVQVAAAVGNVSALEEFRKYDASSLKLKDEEGSTLLHYTCANKQKKATTWLVRHGSSKKRKDAFGLVAKDYKEAAKGDEGLLACFGNGGKRLAQEQLPRLQLQSPGSFRRHSDPPKSIKEKALSETDQSSHATISERQFLVSSETEVEVRHEVKPIQEEDTYALPGNDTPDPLPVTKSDISVKKQMLNGKLSIASDSGRSTVSVDTSSLPTIHRAPKTPPPSEMLRVNLPADESISEDQSSDISMISSHRSFKERLPTGLPNLGNTCYLNAVLQCLYYTKSLSDSFISSRFRDNINYKSEQNGEVARVFGIIVKSLRSGKQTFAAVKQMKDVAGRCDKSYTEDDMKDSQDFLTQMLQWLHQDLSKDVSPDESQLQGQQVSLISTLFFGVHLCTVVCQESGTELHQTEETFSHLTLPVDISGSTDLQDMLTKSYKPTLILWSCATCSKDHMCLKKLKILRLPSHLIINFSRDAETKENLMDAKSKLIYPLEDLSLNDYVFDSSIGRSTYELYAICNQKGHGDSSHHTACCMTANPPIWCLFNDLTVNPITRDDVTHQPHSHILFYKMSSASYHSTGV